MSDAMVLAGQGRATARRRDAPGLVRAQGFLNSGAAVEQRHEKLDKLVRLLGIGHLHATVGYWVASVKKSGEPEMGMRNTKLTMSRRINERMPLFAVPWRSS